MYLVERIALQTFFIDKILVWCLHPWVEHVKEVSVYLLKGQWRTQDGITSIYL